MEQKPTGFVTAEIPLTQEEIEEQIAKGFFLTTMLTIVGVPKKYLEEIRM